MCEIRRRHRQCLDCPGVLWSHCSCGANSRHGPCMKLYKSDKSSTHCKEVTNGAASPQIIITDQPHKSPEITTDLLSTNKPKATQSTTIQLTRLIRPLFHFFQYINNTVQPSPATLSRLSWLQLTLAALAISRLRLASSSSTGFLSDLASSH